MKNSIIVSILILFFSSNLFAQYKTVNFNEELVQFNSHEPIPAEKDLLITGMIPATVQIVEVAVFTAKGKATRDPLYKNIWRRQVGNTGTQFKIPFNYKLNAGKEYDFTLNYFNPLTDDAKLELYDQLVQNLENYIDQSFQVGKKKLQFSKKTKHIMGDLNDIVNTGLSNYRTTNQFSFVGFSDIVRGQLKNIEDAKMKNASRIMNDQDKKNAKHNYRHEMINKLKGMVRSETQFVLNNEWNTLYRSYAIDNTETEKRNGYFSINVGYGAVYLGGNLDNLSYGTAPYVGVSFPLSTSTIAPKFFRNASVTLGVFTDNFKDDKDNKITGPIIKKPIYLGLDYKLFQFIRFNAGAAFLEEQGENNGQVDGIEKRVFIQPFVGLSAKINLSIGLDK